MPQPSLNSQSSIKVGLRLCLAAVALVLGYLSGSFSAAQAIAARDLAIAYRIASYDGRLAARLSAQLAWSDVTPAARAQADALAIDALRSEPFSVPAFSALGINADARGEKAAARRYFAQAQALTRRNLQVQLWMIEDAVADGNVSAVLKQYDTTLRVFPSTAEQLFPILAAALEDRQIRGALKPLLMRKPAWGDAFIAYSARHNPDPVATASLLLALRRAGLALPPGADANAIDSLLTAKNVEAAWSYYVVVRPGSGRDRSRDPLFRPVIANPSQFDWVPLGDGALTTGIQQGVFDFAVPPSVGGPMLQQLQLLPPGRYRLTGHSNGIEQEGSAKPYWTLRCEDGREGGRVEVPNSAVSNGAFSGDLLVPPRCPIQRLILVARPSMSVSGLAGQIDRASLTPMGS